MAEIALNTSVPDMKDTANAQGNYHVLNVPFAASSGATVINYVIAPVDGVIVDAYIVGSVTSDGTKTYTVDIDNVTGTDKPIVNAILFDDSPVLTADTATALTLSTTAANLVVAKGDAIKVTVAGGTGAGQGAVKVQIREQ